MEVNGEAVHDLKNDFVIMEQQIVLLEHTLSKMRGKMKKIENDYIKAINNETGKETTG